MARTTRREIEHAFGALMRTIGGDFNEDDPYSGYIKGDGNGWAAVVDRYRLDNTPVYGGWCIMRISNEQGGETSVHGGFLSSGRMKSAEFLSACYFAIRLIESAGMSKCWPK